MRLLKRSLPLILAMPLVLGTGTAFAEENPCNRGGGGQECQGNVANQGDGLPGPGPGVL